MDSMDQVTAGEGAVEGDIPAEGATVATDGKDRLVRDVMHHGVPTVQEEAPLSEVLKVFKLNDARAVIVVDEFDEASGIITEMDMLQHYRNPDSARLKAEDVMEERVYTASPTARLTEVAEMMLEKNIGQLIVVHGHGAAKLGQAMRPVATLGIREIVSAMADEAGV